MVSGAKSIMESLFFAQGDDDASGDEVAQGLGLNAGPGAGAWWKRKEWVHLSSLAISGFGIKAGGQPVEVAGRITGLKW